MRRILHFLKHDDAATAVEYAVMLAFILMSVIAAIGAVGQQTGGMWNDIDTEMQNHGF